MTRRLERYQARYRELAAELAQIGFISPGSIVVRETSCGKPGCRCQADPPQRHGPYYQYSRAVAGKTISKRLTATQAKLYQDWIANRKRLENIIAQMQKISADAGEVLLRQAADQPPTVKDRH